MRLFSKEYIINLNETKVNLEYLDVLRLEEVFDFENFSEEVQQYFQKQGKVVELMLHERSSKYSPPEEAERQLITKYNKYDLLLFQRWKTKRAKKR